MRTAFIAALAAAVALAGCGKSEEQKPAPQSPQPSTQAAPATQPGAQTAQSASQAAQQGSQAATQGLQQLAQGLQQLQQTDASGKPISPVDFEQLIALMPNPSGWTRTEPKGQQVSMGISTSNAEATYTKGPAEVTLKITDSAFNQLLMGPFTMALSMGYSERSSTGFKKATTIGGSPAFEEWDSSAKHGQVGVVVNKRFIIEGNGSNLDSLDPVLELVSQVDLNKLAALK